MPEVAEPERRVKLVRIGQTTFLSWFMTAAGHTPTHIPVPRLDLPDGCQVLAVHPCFETRSIVFTVSHPSFPEVPDGDVIHAIPASWHTEWLPLAQTEPLEVA